MSGRGSLATLVVGVLAATSLVAGCSSSSPRWAKPGATEEQINRDTADCLTASRSTTQGPQGPRMVINQERYRACMANRGYTEEAAK